LIRIGDTFLGRYRVVEDIRQTEYSSLYRGVQVGIEREVAIRMLGEPGAVAPNVVAKFNRELVQLTALRHPSTIALYDCGPTDDNRVFFVSEFVPGVTLSSLIQNEGQIAPRRALAIARQMLGSLQEAHAYGLVHGGVTPHSIMIYDRIDAADIVKVRDFGTAGFMAEIRAMLMRESLTPRGEILGRPRYMAPEVLAGYPATAAADVFGAGLVLYEMLAGCPAVSGTSTTEILAEQFSARPAIASGDGLVPASLLPILCKATAKPMRDRARSIEEILRALDAADAQLARLETDPNDHDAATLAIPPHIRAALRMHADGLPNPVTDNDPAASSETRPLDRLDRRGEAIETGSSGGWSIEADHWEEEEPTSQHARMVHVGSPAARIDGQRPLPRETDDKTRDLTAAEVAIASVPTSDMAGSPKPYAAGLAKALSHEPTYDRAELTGVEDLAQSLRERVADDRTPEEQTLDTDAPVWFDDDDDDDEAEGTVEVELGDDQVDADRTREVGLGSVLEAAALRGHLRIRNVRDDNE
jgi:serine/threonine protein kinase